MMRLLRRLLLLAALIGFVVSVVLLLNFTAPNPTGRRYSSESSIRGGGTGNSNVIGLSAENILSQDLGLPRNELPEQRQCICSSSSTTVPPSNECRICITTVELLSPSHRRPDFIGSNFIAESKNAQNLLYRGREMDQISDYVFAARAMNIPLWIYVRVDTVLDPEFIRLARSTGGGVVRYFTYPGYVDPIDEAAEAGLMVSAGVVVVGILWELAARRHGTQQRARKRKSPSDPLNEAEALKERAKRRLEKAAAEEDLVI
jgi:hypothetical protein